MGSVLLVEDDLLNPILVLLPLDILRPLPLPFCFQLRLHVAGGPLQQQRRMKKCDLWCAVLLLTKVADPDVFGPPGSGSTSQRGKDPDLDPAQDPSIIKQYL
jgi:hypothetical protein